MKLRLLSSLTFGALMLLSASGAFAFLADTAVHEPADYGMQPPAKGSSYEDPVFGSRISRVSDARNTSNSAGAGQLSYVMTEYSTVSPFNKGSSRFILQHGSYFGLYSGAGKYLRDLPFAISASTEPRWSRTDPDVLYYLTANRLARYDQGADRTEVVHTFSEYGWVSGNGESDIGFQGDAFVLVGEGKEIFVFDVARGQKSPVLPTGGRAFDSVYLTPNGNVLVSWLAHGSDRYNGVEMYDARMSFVRQITTAGGHMDVGRDTNGDEVLLWTNAADRAPICNNGVVKVRLANAQQTCLVTLDWSLAVNVSAPDGNGWVYVATYAPSDPSPGSGGWKTYTNELLKVKLDGSRVERLAHHRSRPLNGYNYTPRPAVSRDGSRILFSSNFGLQDSGYPTEYSDAYLIDLTGTTGGGGGGNDDGGGTDDGGGNDGGGGNDDGGGGDTALLQETDKSIRWRGDWFDNSSGVHSGGGAKLAMDRGSRAILRFRGSGVRWIGYKDQWSGLAVVIVDGKKRRVNTYANPADPQSVIHSVTGLPKGKHRLVIRVLGRSRAKSSGSWVWVDAIQVIR